MSVVDQNKNEKSTPHQVLKCQSIGTTSYVSSTPVSRNRVSRNLVKSFVSSKFVSRHPVLRKAECLYRVMHVSSAAGSTQKVHPQRHYLQSVSTTISVSPRKVLSQFVSALRRKKHASTCRKISNAATIKNNRTMAGRPGMLKEFTDIVPPKPEIPRHLGSPCHHLDYQGFTRTH